MSEWIYFIHPPRGNGTNTGVAVVVGAGRAATQLIMEEVRAIAGGFAPGELRLFRASVLRGRD